MYWEILAESSKKSAPGCADTATPQGLWLEPLGRSFCSSVGVVALDQQIDKILTRSRAQKDDAAEKVTIAPHRALFSLPSILLFGTLAFSAVCVTLTSILQPPSLSVCCCCCWLLAAGCWLLRSPTHSSQVNAAHHTAH